MPLQQRPQQPIASLKQWLSVVTPTIRTCIRSFGERLQTSNQSITSFLSTVTSKSRTDQASTPSAKTAITLITNSVHDNTTQHPSCLLRQRRGTAQQSSQAAINRTYATSDKNVSTSDCSHRAKSWQSRLRQRDKHGKVTSIPTQHWQADTEDKRNQFHTKTRPATVSLFLPWRDVRYRDQDASLSTIREQNKSEATLDVCTNDSQESLSPCEK